MKCFWCKKCDEEVVEKKCKKLPIILGIVAAVVAIAGIVVLVLKLTKPDYVEEFEDDEDDDDFGFNDLDDIVEDAAAEAEQNVESVIDNE